jgi:acyl-coenzyme A thioesterase PaaI-like protein
MMNQEGRKNLPKPVKTGCFGCGADNPMGLNLSFYCVGKTVRSDLSLTQHHMGWENLAHGGIISTILDEILGWSVLAFKRVFFVTRKIEVRYLRPVELNAPLTAVGMIESDAPPKGCTATGWLLDAQGRKLAEGRTQMTYLSGKRLPLLPEAYKTEMEQLFDQIRELLG